MSANSPACAGPGTVSLRSLVWLRCIGGRCGRPWARECRSGGEICCGKREPACARPRQIWHRATARERVGRYETRARVPCGPAAVAGSAAWGSSGVADYAALPGMCCDRADEASPVRGGGAGGLTRPDRIPVAGGPGLGASPVVISAQYGRLGDRTVRRRPSSVIPVGSGPEDDDRAGRRCRPGRLPFGRCPGPVASGQRTRCAAATILRSDASTSAGPRVFSPQSGLTQRRSAGTAFSAAWSALVTSSVLGTRGEWIS